MFRIEASTSHDGGMVRPYQEADWRAAQIASDLAVFLQERLGMEVLVVYHTDYLDGMPAAWCRVEFPRIGHGIAKFLVFKNLGQGPTRPEEWVAGTTNRAEFFDRMLRAAAHSMNRTLSDRLRSLAWLTEQAQIILKADEPAVPA